MTAYGRPPTSTTAVAIASSIGTELWPKRAIPARSPSASAKAAPRTSATSSTVWCSSTCEVAVGRDGEVEQAVVRERAEQVVVEADPGLDRAVAPSPSRASVTVISVSRGRARHGDAATLARADLDANRAGSSSGSLRGGAWRRRR